MSEITQAIFTKLDRMDGRLGAIEGSIIEIESNVKRKVDDITLVKEFVKFEKEIDDKFKNCPHKNDKAPTDWVKLAKITGVTLAPFLTALGTYLSVG